MTTAQKAIKITAIICGVALAVGIIASIISLLGMIVGIGNIGDSAVNDYITTYEVSSEVKSLKIEIGAAELKIEEADKFSVESNLKWLTVKEMGGELKITEKTHSSASYKNPILTVYVPKDFEFDKITINSGAGAVSVAALRAKTVLLELGAGKVEFEKLYATSSVEIEGGAGAIVIKGGELRSLDLSMGVGEANITTALTGDCDLEFGVGGAKINILGDKNDYRMDIDRGFGDIRVDGESISNSAIIGNGANKIEIDGGIGSINISFTK